MLHPQLTLPLGTASSSTFDSYWPGNANANTAASLLAFCASKQASGKATEQQFYIWGATAVGKTHLLSAACQKLAELGFQVAYLTGELASSEGALIGIENADLFCLDDLHQLESRSEELLFHCINRCRDSGTRLLFASECAIDELPISLPDLKTRLSWGTVFKLQTLNDTELPGALNHLLNLRGLSVSDDVIDYILRRYPRNMVALSDLVEQLDQASLSEQRRITIPLVRDLVRDLARELGNEN